MKYSIIYFLLVTTVSLHGQKIFDLSIEIQAYPTGLIPGIHLERSISDQSTILLRLGYNWFRHRDLGVHDNEKGNGIGFTAGYKRYFKDDFRGWHIAFKNDVWWNEVDWYDIEPNDNRIDGNTSITVLQPTLEVGFTLTKNNSFILTPAIGFGFEWNVKTNGEPTGEGAILLIGLQIGKRF